MPPAVRGLEPWEDDLAGLGFERAADGRSWRRGTCTVAAEGAWVTVTDDTDVSALDPLRAMNGHPGLWRIASRPVGGTPRRVFELVADFAEVGSAAALDADGTLIHLIEWALATSSGDVPRGWTSPRPSTIDTWSVRDDLNLRAGGSLVEGAIVADPYRFAIQFGLPTAPTGPLSPSRRAWLERLLRDAQDSWRLVRIGVEDDGSAKAEVDLTGAPHSALARLSRTAIDTLHWVVAWIIPSLVFVADPSRGSEALEARLPRPASRPRRGSRT